MSMKSLAFLGQKVGRREKRKGVMFYVDRS